MSHESEYSTLALNILGYVGGGIIAICHVPQLIMMWKTKSADDLSYMHLLWYLIGLVLLVIYMIGIQALAGWVSHVFEIAFVVGVIGLKFYLAYDKKKQTVAEESGRSSTFFDIEHQATNQDFSC